jgi:multicomponent Na+:H+ antiporter subunit E
LTQEKSDKSNVEDDGGASIRGHWLSHIVSLTALLTVLWLLLSGFYTPLILSLGAVSIALTLFISTRMDLLDYEGLPFHIAFKTTMRYWPWLIWEIVLANIDVIKRILSPKLDISPTLFTAKTSQLTDLGVVIYANSITLTPGTVSVDINPGEIQVHALSQEGADGILNGEMDARCRALEKG